MSDNKHDNIIRFPGTAPATAKPSPADAFLEVMRSISEEKPQSKKPKKKAKAPSQSIEGDQNTQIGGRKKVSQSIQGDGNTQIAGSVQSLTVNTGSSSKIVLTPPKGAIAANVALLNRVKALIKEVEGHRSKRMGKSFKYGVLHKEMARGFGLKDWHEIWLWDESRAEELITWLEDKRDNTQQGRVNKASKEDGFLHTRGHLFKLEKDYLGQLGWPDNLIRERRRLIVGYASRTDLSDSAFRNWVAYLRREAEQMYGETDH